ncbi:GntR family transcriptional regulator [Paragemmobacter straminiformis]|uniref:GntR family transcriptional regulator n=1 Tax=Paragemmobacter straminiformis TaxID=2045119 RepID=A0A842I7Y5_9RHOB|nr:GntR family transcriptional regulator [Gemmobacter straminiformis]MBC2835749.1 GntR family transcriptional regulator [Gemmobacter straminiformis]
MSRQSHRDRIYDLLLTRIQNGEVGWQDRLVDVNLGMELGVSRMPVRDALLQLAAEGYLVATTRGFTLPSLTPAEVLEVFELRRLLEPRAAAMAAQAMTPERLDALAQAVEQAQGTLGSGDIPLFFRASERFRSGWLSMVPNRALLDTIRRYMAQVQTVRLTTMRDPVSHAVVIAGQRELLAAFAARDVVGASDRMLRFVVEGEQAFRRLAAI